MVIFSAHWRNCSIKVFIATFRPSRELEKNTLFVWNWLTIWSGIDIHFLPPYLEYCDHYKCILLDSIMQFAFRTALILRGIDSTRCWKRSSEILVHIDTIASHSCSRFVGCTSMMRISRSTTSQRCSIGLRSGDCGGHLSKVNSFSCSRNQSEMIYALWHYPAGSSYKKMGIKGWTWSATILR